MIQDTNTHQKHPNCCMWKPRIPSHQYLDTEYVSILNSPPALCSVNGITNRRSSYRTTVVQTTIITTKTRIHVIILIIPIQNPNITLYPEINFQLSILKNKKQFQISNSKIKFDLIPTSPQQLALSLLGPTVIS